jgi:hypothetical protein
MVFHLFRQSNPPSKEYSVQEPKSVLHGSDVEINEDENIVVLGKDRLCLKDVMNVCINRDPIDDDEIGGSIVITTRELQDDHMHISKKKYKHTFSDASTGKMNNLIERLKERGIEPLESRVIDSAFRRGFLFGD